MTVWTPAEAHHPPPHAPQLLGRVGYVDQKHPDINWSRKKGPWADKGKGLTSTSHKTVGERNISEVRPLSVWQASLSFQGMRSRANEIAAAIQRHEENSTDVQRQERSSAARFSVGERVVAKDYLDHIPGFEAEITEINTKVRVSHCGSGHALEVISGSAQRAAGEVCAVCHGRIAKGEDIGVCGPCNRQWWACSECRAPGPAIVTANISYVSSSGEVPTLYMPLARSTVSPNTPLHFALQKENAVNIKIKDLHRLSELDVRADARTRLVTKEFKFEDETEGGDDDDDKVLLRALQPF